MDVQLELLIRLQQVDIKISQLLETISALPHNLRSLEEKLQQQKVTLEQFRGKRHGAEGWKATVRISSKS